MNIKIVIKFVYEFEIYDKVFAFTKYCSRTPAMKIRKKYLVEKNMSYPGNNILLFELILCCRNKYGFLRNTQHLLTCCIEGLSHNTRQSLCYLLLVSIKNLSSIIHYNASKLQNTNEREKLFLFAKIAINFILECIAK